MSGGSVAFSRGIAISAEMGPIDRSLITMSSTPTARDAKTRRFISSSD